MNTPTPPPLPWEMPAETKPAAAQSGRPQTPQFADRAEREAYYRQKHFAGTGHPEATAYDDLMAARGKPTTARATTQNGAETLTLEMPPYMFPVLIGISKAIGFGIGTLKLIWHVFAMITAIVLIGTLIGVLTA